MRLRSDEQLVALFRAGHDEAFRVIHDRYRQRLFAYTRQMLVSRQDAEDALQDVFVRAYAGLRASDRELALRAWLYRVAHNRCIDELRRPSPPPPEVMEMLRSPVHDPITEADQRESLRRLIADVRRLPAQQRSALLMRELGGMAYADMSAALGVTTPAVKSLLVRARLSLAQALEARDTACSEIREELIVSHDRGLRPNATARRHMRDCDGCREFRHQLRGVSRRFAAIVPTLGPLGVLANMVGIGGAGAGSGAAGGAIAAGGAAGSGTAVVSVGAVSAGATHVATLLAAAVVTAGGAVELQHTLPAPAHHAHHARLAHMTRVPPPATTPTPASTAASNPAASTVSPYVVTQTPAPRASTLAGGPASTAPTSAGAQSASSTPTTTTTVTVEVKPRATGGTTTPISPGGVAPTDRGDGTSSGAAGSSTTASNGSSTSSTTSSTESGQSTSGSTSGTQTTSTTPIQPTSSSSSTGSTQSTTSGTGSSTGTATSGTTSPSQ